MMMFTAQVVAPFIAPALAVAGAAMVTVPLAIHLLSRWRRRPQPFGAMRFLIEAYRKQKRRMHMEQWLLLLVRCLIVLLLGLALARPLLVGLLGSLLGGLDTSGRVVHIVIDDALSSHAEDGPDATRFDRLIEDASSIVESMEPGDRAMLWRAGRPAEALTDGPTQDRDALITTLDAMRPGFGRSDLSGALDLIQDSYGELSDSTQTLTFLLSDFTRSAEPVDAVTDAADRRDDPRHVFIASRPTSSVDNLQVVSVEPRRRVVWAGSLSGSRIETEVKLARYADSLPARDVALTVELIDSDGKRVASTQRRASLATGQQALTVGVDLPIDAPVGGSDPAGGELLTIRARLTDDADGLNEDNVAHQVVEVRRRLRVALIDEADADVSAQGGGLSPGQWTSLALDPQIAGSSGLIDVVRLTPAQMNAPDSLQGLEAVLLLRPDRVTRTGWRDLHAFADQGGLVWVFTPTHEGASPWVSLLNEFFEPTWRIGLEPERIDEDAAPIGIASGPLLVEPLERLAADWQALTQPLRVQRYLPIETNEQDAWITLSDTPLIRSSEEADAKASRVLLAHRRVGLGSLMMLSTAVDTRWTNLPTKPMFVPLIHETLHGVLGTRDRPGVIKAVAGDHPALTSAWSGVTKLDRLMTSDDPFPLPPGGDERAQSPALRVDASGIALADPIRQPGVYQAQTDLGPRRLVVDIDARGGDTRQIDDEALTHWLNSLGTWAWLDSEQPGAALERSTQTADIGWALLWGVLALVLIEAFLARVFSHANAGRSESLTVQIWHTLVRLRNGHHARRDTGEST